MNDLENFSVEKKEVDDDGKPPTNTIGFFGLLGRISTFLQESTFDQQTIKDALLMGPAFNPYAISRSGCLDGFKRY